jgi:hypothetical protein
MYDLRFKHPFNLLITGFSQSGKTSWVRNLLKVGDHLLTEKPAYVLLFYRAMQPIYNDMLAENLVNKLIDVSVQFPTLDEIYQLIEPYKDNGGSLMIFDDTMSDVTTDFEQLFCNVSHHLNSSIIFLTQNMFYNNKSFRTMSLNSHYIIVMKNPRDTQQISILARQFKPTNSEFVVKSYKDATKKNYSYLVIDFSPNSPETTRIRTDIFPNEAPLKIYLEK